MKRICPKCKGAMEESQAYHGLPVVSVQEPLFSTAYVPVYVYECVRCRYIELHGTRKRLRGKAQKRKKRK